jgi:hypothetical protein
LEPGEYFIGIGDLARREAYARSPIPPELRIEYDLAGHAGLVRRDTPLEEVSRALARLAAP